MVDASRSVQIAALRHVRMCWRPAEAARHSSWGASRKGRPTSPANDQGQPGIGDEIRLVEHGVDHARACNDCISRVPPLLGPDVSFARTSSQVRRHPRGHSRAARRIRSVNPGSGSGMVNPRSPEANQTLYPKTRACNWSLALIVEPPAHQYVTQVAPLTAAG